MTALLTDDELVAIAVEQKSQWLGNLPTVVASDAGQLASASARGYRSLAVRELLGGTGTSRLAPDILAVVGPAVGHRPVIYAYVAQKADPLAVTGASIAVFSGSDAGSNTVVVTLASGINEIQVFDTALAESAVLSFVKQVYLNGLGSAEEDESREVVALFLEGPGGVAVRASKGTVHKGILLETEGVAAIDNDLKLESFPDELFTSTP